MRFKLLLSLLILILLVGCSETNTENNETNTENNEEKCVSELVCQTPNPTNTTLEFNYVMTKNESCYDLDADPKHYREEVNEVIKNHPNDWEKHLNWSSEGDVEVSFIVNESINEIKCEKIFIDKEY